MGPTSKDATINGLGDHKPKNRIETSLWQTWVWVAWIERGQQLLGTEKLRWKVIRIRDSFTTQTSTLAKLELDCHSRLNKFTLTDSLISSWVECLCSSIAAGQTLPVRFVRPTFHGQTHCAHAFGSFVWYYSARFSDMLNSGLLPEWKEISVQLTFKHLFENIVSQCDAMRTSQSISWVDLSKCESNGVLSTQSALSMCK